MISIAIGIDKQISVNYLFYLSISYQLKNIGITIGIVTPIK